MVYRDLEIYKVSLQLFFEAHRLSLYLPKYETYELGSQLRRAADSVNSNIVEGYGRRNYKNDYLKFLIYSHSSNDETINHLLKIAELYKKHRVEANLLKEQYENLGGKINRFISHVRKNWHPK